MIYPRIFSLSTVGLRRHYNQDYLFHPERTDFVGSNGVGKSIIADLLQLIFITDRDLIVFGTESLKDEKRHPHTLPYQTSEAYAFLNVEVSKDNFISIGVCIPNHHARRIMPFIVINSPDMDADISLNTYSRERVLTSAHFLDNDKIPSINDLSKNMRNKHKLVLKHFTHKSDKEEYYRFLFTKNILPINLGIEDNLKAFAKVIQSFSKAKTLDTKNSNSLKEFLFETSDTEYEKTFLMHQEALEKLISDFKDLDKQIADIETKQASLTSLKNRESKMEEKELTKRIKELDWHRGELFRFETSYKDEKKEAEKLRKKKTILEAREPKLKRLLAHIAASYQSATNNFAALSSYKDEMQKTIQLLQDVDKLRSIEPLGIPDLNSNDINFEKYNANDIVELIKKVKPLVEEYSTIKSMEAKVLQQGQIIETYKLKIKDEITSLQELSRILSHNANNTLFNKILERKESLTESQEAILFSLLDVNWGKPKKPKEGFRYVTTMEILDKKNIEEDVANNGYWFKNGALFSFISKLKVKPLFGNPERLARALEDKQEEIDRELADKTRALAEIENLILKKRYDKTKSGLDYEFDLRLMDGSSLESIVHDASVISKCNEKIYELNQNIKEIEENLGEIAKEVTFEIDKENIDQQTQKAREIATNLETRKSKLEKIQATEIGELQVIEATLPLIDSKVEQEYTKYEQALEKFLHVQGRMQESHPDFKHIPSTKEITTGDLEAAEVEADNSRIDYVTEYKTVASQFNETKDNAEPTVKEEIETQRYKFAVLERALLGPKIGYLDKIGPYLQDANTVRLKMMDTLHETMLKVFSITSTKYKDYERVVKNLNAFFKGRKISEYYYFKVQFEPAPLFNIDWIEQLKSEARQVFKRGELNFGESSEKFISDFFARVTGTSKKVHLKDLLNPKTYFDLSVALTDENGKENPGSTGESYTAILLLGIGRLSKVQDQERPGLRFVILEETANLDNTNFSTFPNMAEEFKYQLITMTPRPYGSDSSKGWYLHHLIKGFDNPDINYPIPSSYYKTNQNKEDLMTYLAALKN